VGRPGNPGGDDPAPIRSKWEFRPQDGNGLLFVLLLRHRLIAVGPAERHQAVHDGHVGSIAAPEKKRP